MPVIYLHISTQSRWVNWNLSQSCFWLIIGENSFNKVTVCLSLRTQNVALLLKFMYRFYNKVDLSWVSLSRNFIIQMALDHQGVHDTKYPPFLEKKGCWHYYHCVWSQKKVYFFCNPFITIYPF